MTKNTDNKHHSTNPQGVPREPPDGAGEGREGVEVRAGVGSGGGAGQGAGAAGGGDGGAAGLRAAGCVCAFRVLWGVCERVVCIYVYI